MRLSEVTDELAIATRAEGRSPRTVEAYREKLRHLTRFLGDPPIEAVTVGDLRRFLAAQRDKGLSEFTIKSRVRALKRLWNFAEAEGIIENNPTKRIKTPNPESNEPKAVSWPDFLALLKTTEAGDLADVRDRAVLFFLLDTGCRVGGLCGLRVDDLDLERRRAKVCEKGNKTRFVFFEEPTAQALVDWLEARPQDRGDWLFTSFGGKSDKLTMRGVSHMLARRGKQAGCKGPHNPHAFRHAFAINYVMDGGDIGTLSKLMGHGDVSVTIRYYGRYALGDLQEKHGRHSPIAKLGGGENGK